MVNLKDAVLDTMVEYNAPITIGGMSLLTEMDRKDVHIAMLELCLEGKIQRISMTNGFAFGPTLTAKVSKALNETCANQLTAQEVQKGFAQEWDVKHVFTILEDMKRSGLAIEIAKNGQTSFRLAD